ncbi:uncharacterized protein LOC113523184 isoform X2 [Galleria mellonella]|nr:uncharacterized protein LOC113523184 isoform X2 [Galleria mellonella]
MSDSRQERRYDSYDQNQQGQYNYQQYSNQTPQNYQNNQAGLNPYRAISSSVPYNQQMAKPLMPPIPNNYMSYNIQQQQPTPLLVQYPVPVPIQQGSGNNYSFNRSDGNRSYNTDDRRSNNDSSYTNRNSGWDQSDRDNKGRVQMWDGNKDSKYKPEDAFNKDHDDVKGRKRTFDDYDQSRGGPAKFQRNTPFNNPPRALPNQEASTSNIYGKHATNNYSNNSNKPNVNTKPNIPKSYFRIEGPSTFYQKDTFKGNYYKSTLKPEIDQVKRLQMTPAEVKESRKKAANRDDTFRHQAVIEIATELLNARGFTSVARKKVGFIEMKKIIRKRLDQVLGDKIGLEKNLMKLKYKKSFPFEADQKLCALYTESRPAEGTLAPSSDPKTTKVNNTLFTKEDEKRYQGLVEAKKPAAAAAAATTADSATTAVKPDQTATPNQTNQAPAKPGAPARPAPISWVQKSAFTPKPAPKKKSAPASFLKPDKKTACEQRQLMKQEYLSDNCYVLPPILNEALDKEMKALSDLYLETCKPASNTSDEASVLKKVVEALGEFEWAIKLQLTKRLLNIRTNLSLRIFSLGKRTTREAVAMFLVRYGVIAVKKSGNNKDFFIADCDSYESYDELCAMGNILMDSGQTTLAAKPLHVTMPVKYWNKNLQKKTSEYNPPGGYQKNKEFYEDLDVNFGPPADAVKSERNDNNASEDSKTAAETSDDLIEVTSVDNKEIIDVDAEECNDGDKDEGIKANGNENGADFESNDNTGEKVADEGTNEDTSKDVTGEEDVDDIELNEDDLEDY